MRISKEKPLFLDSLTTTELAETKLQHGLSNVPYEIGVFGSSRNVNVNSGDLGLPNKSFFNFAVPGGTSIRWSLHILEQLSLTGHAPRAAIIMFDHAELQVYGNPWLSPLPTRWKHAALDLKAGLDSSLISHKDVLRMIWRYGFQEFRIFKRSFNWELLTRGILYYLGLGNNYARPAKAGEVGYARDGSRPLPADPNAKINIIKPGLPSVIMGYLSTDLERLAAIRNRGVRVIIYESPIHPKSAEKFELNVSPIAKRTRQHFLAECRRFELECHLAIPSNKLLKTKLWRDATHPPAAFLSSYLRSLIIH
ncbi:MAG: hypothetical protein HOJ13_04015 [Nitrospina sp.]|nr:hypothetical protein [Nitrospina sp.]